MLQFSKQSTCFFFTDWLIKCKGFWLVTRNNLCIFNEVYFMPKATANLSLVTSLCRDWSRQVMWSQRLFKHF